MSKSILVFEAFSVVNIALKKPSELSSMYEPPHYECCDSDYAVDGYIHDWVNGDFFCAHTDHVEDKQEWWSVDLQDVYTIDYTYIYGRTDCCVDTLANFDVEVISPGTCNRWNNFAIGNIFHCQYQPTGVQQITITCPPNTSGRFVRIKRRDLLPLVICELEVYGNLSNSHLESGLESKTKTAYACGHIGYRYLGPVIYTSVAQSNIECTTMCITKTACTAAEYVKKTNVCLLKGKSPNGTHPSLQPDSDKNVFFIQ
ncbi:unnamed protein product [Mytilus edulis]|uniref:F5/8 type C domain-containing protein n=2 Tax=Mytilus TaxID=6548 RepID=A0A8B6CAS7_MYTGA|nr:unnamed protein product [Mytilus edulis]VDI02541.1 Hypothetical predicted protein [Mytilus galloprovincialis]